jgi:hypothetical protein
MAISESTTPDTGDVQLPATAQASVLEDFPERRLTVGDFTPEPTCWPVDDAWVKTTPPAPFLRLKGRWLDQAGFTIGSKVRVAVKPGRLVIETVSETPEPEPRLPRRAQRLFV